MSERICIQPYISALDRHFTNGGSIRNTDKIRERFLRREETYHVKFVTLLHRVAISKQVLTLVALYELSRFKLPFLPEIDETLMKAKSIEKGVRRMFKGS